MGRAFPPPQFGVPLSTEEMGNELPFEAIYGITPSNKYIPISIDSQGRLNTTATLIGTVTIGQIGEVDGSPFAYGATRQQVFGGVYQDTNPTLLSGEQGAVRLTEYRAFHVNLRDSLGTEISSTAGSLDVHLTNPTIAVTQSTTPWIVGLPANAAKETGGNLDSINAGIQTLNSLVPSKYDYIDLQYSGNNLTQAKFYLGGPGGSVVSTLTLMYTGSNLTSVQKS